MSVYFTMPRNVEHGMYIEYVLNPPVDYIYTYDTKIPRELWLIEDIVRYRLRDMLRLRLYYTLVDCDLIHATGTLITNRKPWVVDFEHLVAFVDFRYSPIPFYTRGLLKGIIRKLLISKHCKRILPMSIAAYKGLLNLVPEVKNKTEILYPALSIPEPCSRRKIDDTINILFIAKAFERKGGREVLMCFDRLVRKYSSVHFTVVSNVPTELKRRYEQEHEGLISFLPVQPRSVLYTTIFPEADIFLFPTTGDTFGMVILEAMAFGIPVVTTDSFAVPEMVEDGINGFLVREYIPRWYTNKFFHHSFSWEQLDSTRPKRERERFVNDLCEKLSLLIEDAELRKKMGDAGREKVRSGQFSVSHRNKRLKEIYEESMRR